MVEALREPMMPILPFRSTAEESNETAYFLYIVARTSFATLSAKLSLSRPYAMMYANEFKDRYRETFAIYRGSRAVIVANCENKVRLTS